MRCLFPLFFCLHIYILYFFAFEMHTLIYEVVPQQILPAIFFQPFHRIAQPFLRGGYIPGAWYSFLLRPALRVRVV